MTRLEVQELIRTSRSLLLQCANCNSQDLRCPEHPRGDDAIECRTCGDWSTYAALEAIAVARTRKMLAMDFPEMRLELH
jgi:flavoprotein